MVSKAFGRGYATPSIYEVEMGVDRRAGMRSQHMRQKSDRLDKTIAKECMSSGWFAENIMNGKARRNMMAACRKLTVPNHSHDCMQIRASTSAAGTGSGTGAAEVKSETNKVDKPP